MRYRGKAYRAHNPRWSFAPTSGEGAARNGGRFNTKGTPALYLSLTVHGCILEATQGLQNRMNPLTIVEYDVDIADVVDLTSEQERRRLDVPMDALACGWLADHARGRVPLSWAIADRLSSVFAGMLVKSFAPDASDHDVNLVLWHWNDHHGTVQPFDPEGRLPNEPWLR